MIDMSHDNHNRRPRAKILLRIRLRILDELRDDIDLLLLLAEDIVVDRDVLRLLVAKLRIERHHLSFEEELFDDLGGLLLHLVRELLDGDRLRKRDGLDRLLHRLHILRPDEGASSRLLTLVLQLIVPLIGLRRTVLILLSVAPVLLRKAGLLGLEALIPIALLLRSRGIMLYAAPGLLRRSGTRGSRSPPPGCARGSRPLRIPEGPLSLPARSRSPRAIGPESTASLPAIVRGSAPSLLPRPAGRSGRIRLRLLSLLLFSRSGSSCEGQRPLRSLFRGSRCGSPLIERLLLRGAPLLLRFFRLFRPELLRSLLLGAGDLLLLPLPLLLVQLLQRSHTGGAGRQGPSVRRKRLLLLLLRFLLRAPSAALFRPLSESSAKRMILMIDRVLGVENNGELFLLWSRSVLRPPVFQIFVAFLCHSLSPPSKIRFICSEKPASSMLTDERSSLPIQCPSSLFVPTS